MSTPVALTINVRDANTHAELPSRLIERLNSTPTKSPEDLAEELKAHTERTSKLRSAHLEAVRDRAARENQRAQEAVARKLRLASSRADKVQRKLEAAFSKTEAKKEADEAEREARKARREGLAQAVAEARKAQGESRALRQAELLEAEKAASAKHAKAVGDVMAKGKSAVAHAFAVAQAHKDAILQDAAKRGDVLAGKLQAAEVRRQSLSLTSAPIEKPGAADALHRVRNEGKFAAEMRKKAHEQSMAKAEEKRQAHIMSVVTKAHEANAKAAAVVAKNKAVTSGTDEATINARHAMYERIVTAEVARLSALKAKMSHSKLNAHKGDTVGAIVVRLDDVVTPRAPPATLIKRLATKGHTLLATAKARQLGAYSRREMIKHGKLLSAAKANARRAAALSSFSKTSAMKTSGLEAKAARALITTALALGKKEHTIAMEKQRTANVAAKRTEYDLGLKSIGEHKKAKHAAAAERRGKAIRSIAKGGVSAVRLAAFTTRREALRTALIAKGEMKAARCDKAAANHAAFLQKRVEVAKKLQATSQA